MPPLLAANYDANKIYHAVQDQLIVSMGGAVAINQGTLIKVMELYQIDDRIDCFEKVVAASREVIRRDHERAEANKPVKG